MDARKSTEDGGPRGSRGTCFIVAGPGIQQCDAVVQIPALWRLESGNLFLVQKRGMMRCKCDVSDP